MKKLLALLLAAIMVVALFAACGGGGEGAPAGDDDIQVDVDASSPFAASIVIAHLPKSVGGAWFNRMLQGMGQYAGLTGSTTFQVGPSTGDAAAQNTYMQELIAQGVDAIAVIPVSPEQIEGATKEAMDAGIVVVTAESQNMTNFDYDIETYDFDDYGAQAGEFMAEGMGKAGEYILMVGFNASTSHVLAAQGIQKYMEANCPDITLVTGDGAYIETTNNAAVAYETALEVFGTYPEAKGVYNASSTDVPGVAKAIQELGLSEQTTFVAQSVPNSTRTYFADSSIDCVMGVDPADVGVGLCKLAAAAYNDYKIVEGDDLGVPGWTKVYVRTNDAGKEYIVGNSWNVITADNIGEYFY